MGRPRSLELELEAVTPLWIGGANLKAELRAPSVRGCLRYWLRSLLGGTVGDRLPEIRAAESAVYGHTQRASAVVVRLTGSPDIGMVTPEQTDPPLAGLNYMYWSVFQQKRDAILPGQRFHLKIHTQPFPLDPMDADGRRLDMNDSFELAMASLWLLIRMGGVGCRVRRGAGNIRALANPAGWPTELPPLVGTATTPEELAAELAAGVRQIRAFARWTGPAPVEPSSFDILHDNVCQVCVASRTFGSWWEAVNWAGERFLAFRVAQREDASAVAGLLTRGQMAAATIVRAVFGLPITFFFKTIFTALVGQGMDSRDARKRASATVSPVRGLARGSPLFFRVVRLAGDPPQFAVLMGVFCSRLLPDHEIVVKPNDPSIRPVRVATPKDHALIRRWFTDLEAQGVPLVPVSLGSSPAGAMGS